MQEREKFENPSSSYLETWLLEMSGDGMDVKGTG